jgi:hypothetical protein
VSEVAPACPVVFSPHGYWNEAKAPPSLRLQRFAILRLSHRLG